MTLAVVVVVPIIVVMVLMAVTLPTVMVMVVVVPMVVIVVMAVALAVVVVMVLMVMVVTVTFHMLVQLVVESRVVHGMVHPVSEFVLIYVEDCAHEGEVHPLLGLHGAVVLDTVLQVGEVQGDSGTVIEGDGGLDVSEQASGLLLDPLPDGEEGLGEPCLSIGVEAVDLPGESHRTSSGLLDGGLLVMLVVVIVVVLAHCIISYTLSRFSSFLAEMAWTGLSGNCSFIHFVISSS